MGEALAGAENHETLMASEKQHTTELLASEKQHTTELLASEKRHNAELLASEKRHNAELRDVYSDMPRSCWSARSRSTRIYGPSLNSLPARRPCYKMA